MLDFSALHASCFCCSSASKSPASLARFSSAAFFSATSALISSADMPRSRYALAYAWRILLAFLRSASSAPSSARTCPRCPRPRDETCRRVRCRARETVQERRRARRASIAEASVQHPAGRRERPAHEKSRHRDHLGTAQLRNFGVGASRLRAPGQRPRLSSLPGSTLQSRLGEHRASRQPRRHAARKARHPVNAALRCNRRRAVRYWPARLRAR